MKQFIFKELTWESSSAFESRSFETLPASSLRDKISFSFSAVELCDDDERFSFDCWKNHFNENENNFYNQLSSTFASLISFCNFSTVSLCTLSSDSFSFLASAICLANSLVFSSKVCFRVVSCDFRIIRFQRRENTRTFLPKQRNSQTFV